jgi:hypothetical protein
MISRIVIALAVAGVCSSFVQAPSFEPFHRDLHASATLVNAAADYDRDGDIDLFVGFNGATNRFLLNDRGTLRDVSVAAGIGDKRPTRAAAWGDFDRDGDADLLVGFAPGFGPVLALYRNEAGPFIDATIAAGIRVENGAVRQLAWVDVDADGDLDLFVAFRDRANMLFRNDEGKFSDVAAELGLADARKSVGAVWFDYDEDGDLDLYVGNMDGDPNALYRNDGGRFVDVAEAAGLAWGGRTPKDPAHGTVRPCVADVDGDGRLDLFTANYGPNGLFLNRGNGRFEDVSQAWGVAIDGRYDTCAFADFDNDGRIDLYVNGTVTGGTSYRDYLFRNTGEAFEDVTPESLAAIAADHGALWADFDRDGDVDLALTGAGETPLPLVLRNHLPEADAKRSLKVRVVDGEGRATRPGAEVRIYEAGTKRLLGTRLVDTGSSYNAQSDIPLHFGIPAQGRVDIEVIWPGGSRTPVRQPNVNAPSSRVVTVRVK